MKYLILVRHAKAKKAEGTSLKDIDRPLSIIGYEQAYQMSVEIIPYAKRNTLFISSPSVRTISTAWIFSDRVNHSRSAVQLENSLYPGDAGSHLEVISVVDKSIETVLIFGHNPTISELITRFAGQDYGDVSPGSVAVFKIDADSWEHIRSATSALMAIFSPKT